ncbi:MAG TPA: SDR family oxidoreductase [Chitinophagaceae bacterium]|nr:SDR family oxidoreductase [Chitinophagaceae bacterium]
MILKNKNAIIYGAGGSMGSAVARAFADAGAKVFITGRNISSVQKTANEILDSNGSVEAEQLDAMDENAINGHLERVVQKVGKIDISFNAVGVDVIQNIPLIDIPLDDFISPITLTMRTRFLTSIATGRVMIKQGSGVILFLTATPGGIGYPYTGGFAPACCALECMSKNLASELGVFGIRVVCIRSGGSPDSKVFKEAIDRDPANMALIIRKMEEDTMLKKLPLRADIANVAVFLASDMSAKITGGIIDVTSGTTTGLNYRVRSQDSNYSTFSSQ